MADERLAALGFNDWPFPIVPDDFVTRHLCDRAWLSRLLDQTVDAWKLRSSSMINLLWADIGAGKTHTIRHLQHLAADAGFTASYCFEMPDRSRSFVDFHNTFLLAVGLEDVLNAFMADEKIFDGAPVLRQICRAVFSTASAELSAENWVAGIATTADFRRLGIPSKLSIDQSIANVVALVAGLRKGSPSRTLLFVDEFQRIVSSGRRIAAEIQAGLCSLINRMPESMSLVLSFASDPSDALPEWMHPALISRAGKNHLIPIMSLSNEDARTFIKDILAVYAPVRPSALFPFDESAINKIISMSGGNKVLPRELLGTASHVFERNLEDLVAGRISLIRADHVVVGL
ncbi:MAG TPA: hypothetical protein VGC72_16600 [Candidatus Elarobacter sp.]